MKELSLLSWNVNGIRALIKKKIQKEKNFFTWLLTESPDILCIQETKIQQDQLTETLLKPQGYYSYWNSAEEKGYSGVATFTKEKPVKISYELGINHLDNEGRHIITEYPNFILFNAYFPNGKMNDERLKYKMEYYDVFLKLIEDFHKKGKSIIFCGDVNTAHRPIDLTHPKENETISGFLPIEREWIDKVLSLGYIDTFRHFYPDKAEQYTWWSTRNIGARERNVGWRLDYFFVSKDLIPKVICASIKKDIFGSDHCPVEIKIRI